VIKLAIIGCNTELQELPQKERKREREWEREREGEKEDSSYTIVTDILSAAISQSGFTTANSLQKNSNRPLIQASML
jgi:hypothetical protein